MLSSNQDTGSSLPQRGINGSNAHLAAREPVIEIFQPMVDNSPSDTNTSSNALEPQDDQFFTPLPRRSFGSGSSSSSLNDTPDNNNASTHWRTPNTAHRGSFRTDPLLVGGVVQSGLQTSLNISTQSQQPDKDNYELKHGGFKWKEVLKEKHDIENTSLVNQSGASILSQHPLSTNSDQGSQGLTQNTSGIHQFGTIQIASVPEFLSEGPNMREVIGAEIGDDQGSTDLTQHSFIPSPEKKTGQTQQGERIPHIFSTQFMPPQGGPHQLSNQRHGRKDNLGQEFQRVPQSDTALSQGVSQVTKTTMSIRHSPGVFESSSSHPHGISAGHQPELSAHSLDPSYTHFLPSHHSSQISETGDVLQRNISYSGNITGQGYVEPSQGGHPSDRLHQSPSEVPPHLRTDVVLPAHQELSQHSIDTTLHSAVQGSISAGAGGAFDYSRRSRCEPSKGSFSSVEEPRSQTDHDDVNFRLMPMFSDVSISQQSLSFESDQGQEVSQGQSSVEVRDPMSAMSDRYSLPRTFKNGKMTGLQPGFITGGPDMIFQRWKDGRSESIGQSSVDSGENQFQPLQEVTSSTLSGYEVSDM